MTEMVLRSDVPSALTDQMELCKVLANSELLPNHLRGKPANVLAILYAANAVGVPLWTAMQGMQVISGKVGIDANLARALILSHGHSFRVVESTPEIATVEVIRKGEEFVHSASFTLAEAHTAGLAGGVNYKKYPKAMLIARATTIVARQACADVLAGMSYTAEELGADVDEEGRIVVEQVRAEVDGPRPVEELPRNQNGSVSKRRITDEERAQLEAAGLATAEQRKAHNDLVKMPTGDKKAERLDTVPADDPWVDQPAGELDIQTPSGALWGAWWTDKMAECEDVDTHEVLMGKLRDARNEDKVPSRMFGELTNIGAVRLAEIALGASVS